MSPLTAERVLIFGALYFMYYSPAVAGSADVSSTTSVRTPGSTGKRELAQNQPGRRVFLPLPTKCPLEPVAGEADRPAQLQSH